MSGSPGTLVFKGFWVTSTERIPVAVKEVQVTNSLKKMDVLNEISLMSCIDHKNIVHIYGYYEKENSICIVMEPCDESLRLYMRTPRSIEERRQLLIGITEGLAYAATSRIVHHDLKAAILSLTHR